MPVYFVQSGRQGPVMIDYIQSGRSLEARLRTIQEGTPEPLKLLAVAPGGPAFKRRIHTALRDEHIHGAWFTWCPRLRNIIKSQREQHPQPRIKPTTQRTQRKRAAKIAFERQLADGSLKVYNEKEAEA